MMSDGDDGGDGECHMMLEFDDGVAFLVRYEPSFFAFLVDIAVVASGATKDTGFPEHTCFTRHTEGDDQTNKGVVRN